MHLCVSKLQQLPRATFCTESAPQKHCPGEEVQCSVPGSKVPGRRVCQEGRVISKLSSKEATGMSDNNQSLASTGTLCVRADNRYESCLTL